MTMLRTLSTASSHEGKVRSNNEDAFMSSEVEGLWAVADGMGGHERGEWASAQIIAALKSCDLSTDFESARQSVADCIHEANRSIFDVADAAGSMMGSTIVALLVKSQRFAVLWVGDSRAYLLRGGTLYRLSSDHTQVQELVDRGVLTPEDAENHPMSHALARAVGVMQAVEVDVVEDEVEAGDIFLLCSDGLHGYVPEADIVAHLQSQPPEMLANTLIETTLERGAPDNVTVISVMFSEPTLLSFAAKDSLV
jgi:serine/threonine protein phosphatase Stp1